MHVGVNFWQAPWIGAGDAERLGRELDRLHDRGVRVVRILAGAEGPDGAPERVAPAIQPGPGVWDEALLVGLDVALSEIGRRSMGAIVCLTNFWSWSGGLAQYRAWASGAPVPYPGETGDHGRFERFAAGFYADRDARALFGAHVARIVDRTSSVTGQRYGDDPAIALWEICNEPRGKHDPAGMREFLAETAESIRARASQPITTGSEGSTADPSGAGLDFAADHAHPAIDAATCHLWPENWGLWDPAADDDGAFEAMLAWSRDYLRRHAAIAASLDKPLWLEEVGLARDGGSHDPGATTRRRDRFFEAMLEEAARLGIAGVLFWAWSGEAKPPRPGEPWRHGAPLGGDPPHEPGGWYGMFAEDESTLAVLGRHASRA